MIIETIVYAALIFALFLVCDNGLSKRYYVPLKVVCSASFLCILFINYYYSEKLTMILWALLACFVGDLLMGLYNTYLKKQFMALGIIAFMLGHVGLLNYMCRVTTKTSPWVFLVPILACIGLMVMKKCFKLHMGSLMVPSLIYCYFVTTMSLKAIECGLSGMPWLAIAGILFLVSDFAIIYLYFYHFRSKNIKRVVHFINLSTYYMAILIFIYSL